MSSWDFRNSSKHSCQPVGVSGHATHAQILHDYELARVHGLVSPGRGPKPLTLHSRAEGAENCKNPNLKRARGLHQPAPNRCCECAQAEFVQTTFASTARFPKRASLFFLPSTCHVFTATQHCLLLLYDLLMRRRRPQSLLSNISSTQGTPKPYKAMLKLGSDSQTPQFTIALNPKPYTLKVMLINAPCEIRLKGFGGSLPWCLQRSGCQEATASPLPWTG